MIVNIEHLHLARKKPLRFILGYLSRPVNKLEFLTIPHFDADNANGLQARL
jgi:hypothetical protein